MAEIICGQVSALAGSRLILKGLSLMSDFKVKIQGVLAENLKATFLGNRRLERRRGQWKTPSRGRAIQRCRNVGFPSINSRDNVTASFGLEACLEGSLQKLKLKIPISRLNQIQTSLSQMTSQQTTAMTSAKFSEFVLSIDDLYNMPDLLC
jgi:hypothetical protein